MKPHTVTVLLDIAYFVVQALLLTGLMQWWRRTKHWSFAVLGVALALYVIGNLYFRAESDRLYNDSTAILASEQVRASAPELFKPPTPERLQAQNRLHSRQVVFQFALVLLCGVGGAGLVLAARRPSLAGA